MQIAIKYCGGCNPRYDRTKLVKRLAAAFPDDQVKNAMGSSDYDFLVIVCGCFSACAAKGFDAERTFVVRQEDDFMEACEVISTFKKGCDNK